MNRKQPKIAIVHDWLTDFGGAERVVQALTEAFPGAPVYTSVYEPDQALRQALAGVEVRTTSLQKLPRALRKLHKFFPTMRVRAFRRLDLSEFDVIISSSSAEAKQVKKTRDEQVHICYCHTPVRYYWSHYSEYKQDPGYGKLNWLVRLAMPLIVPVMRRHDYRVAQDVDLFVANSETVKQRIKQYYGRPATVVHPPVGTARFAPKRERGDYYVALGRQVPYKRIDLAVKAATSLSVPLRVYGNGPEHERLRQLAGPSVQFFADRQNEASDQAVEEALNGAKGFIFPTEEDFGIVQVEALAAGAPVIAFGRGGARDIVENGVTGVLFDEQTTESLSAAIKRAEEIRFSPFTLKNRSKRFDKTMFTMKLKKIVSDQVK